MTATEKSVSVLVPIYNVENTLEKCLDSLVAQKLDRIEFILINDGSTDGSLKVIQKYVKEDKRFRILDKVNSGYGDSINRGIELAKGKYIGIVEPDDFCEVDMFEVLYRLAEEKKVEVARGNYYYYSESGDEMRASIYGKYSRTVLDPGKDYKIFQEPPAIWSAIYRRDFLLDNKITLLDTPGASYQDTGFYLKTLVSAERIAFKNSALYHYRIDNPNSSVKDKKKIFALTKEYASVEKFVRKLPDGKKKIEYCQVAKFGNYHWNLTRLSFRDAVNFARSMKNEFEKAKKMGELSKDYFPARYWWSLKALMLLPVPLYVAGLKTIRRVKI